MNDSTGIAHFWAQGDALSHAVAIALLLMSAFSWSIIISKLRTQWQHRRDMRRALDAFWEAPSREAALDAVTAKDRSGVFAEVAGDTIRAAQAWDAHTATGVGSSVDASEYVGRSLQQSVLEAQAQVEKGLTALASIGSTAPFVGLFGTVWGIYHALVGLAGSTQVVLDKVAGPVGEALIMTAAGLFVAIPAVLAYNAFTRSNRIVLAQLDGFAHSLHVWLVGGVRPAHAS